MRMILSYGALLIILLVAVCGGIYIAFVYADKRTKEKEYLQESFHRELPKNNERETVPVLPVATDSGGRSEGLAFDIDDMRQESNDAYSFLQNNQDD